MKTHEITTTLLPFYFLFIANFINGQRSQPRTKIFLKEILIFEYFNLSLIT